MGDETTRVDQWLFETLTGDATLAALVPGGWHAEQSPRGTVFPHGIFALVYAADVQTSSADRFMVNALYSVRVVTEAESFGGDLQAAADRADVLLHRSDGTAGGAVIFSATRDELIRRVENDEGREYRALGATYRIAVQLP